MRILFFSFIIICLSFTLIGQVYQNLGPERNGVFEAGELLKNWPKEGPEKILQVNGIGRGWSAPVATNDQILVTGMIDTLDYLSAYNFNGELLWRQAFGRAWTRSYPDTRSTPTIENERTWVVSGTGQMACFNINNGEKIWSVDVDQKFDASWDIWGVAESPLIVDNMVISVPSGSKTAMVALDKNTGETIWQTTKLRGTRSYVSPVLYKNDRVQLILGMTHEVFFAVDPENGEVVWEYAFRERGRAFENNDNQWPIYANMPLIINNKVFITAGWNFGSILFEISPDGKSVDELWVNRDFDNQQYGVVEHKGCLYGSNWLNLRNGNWLCVDIETGKTLWETTHHNKGIVVKADQMLYLYDEEGNVSLVQPSTNELRIISEFKIVEGSGQHWAHPYIHNGKLYIRHGESLMVYNIKA